MIAFLVLRAGLVRHGRRLVRGRRHRPDHHLKDLSERANVLRRPRPGTVPGRAPNGTCPRVNLQQQFLHSCGRSATDCSSVPARSAQRDTLNLMPELAGRVADAFEARIRAHEESALSPLAVRSYETRGRAPRGGRVRHPDAVPARPRPDRPLEAVPAAEGQDAGLHRPGRRPLPHPDHAHAGDDRDRPRRRPGAAAERGSDGGDRARPRHGPPAVRPRR